MKQIVVALNILFICLTASAAHANSTIGDLQPGGLVQTSDYLPVVRAGCVTEGDCKVQVGSAAAATVGTSGATLGLLNTANTYSNVQTFLSGDLAAADPVFTGGAISLPVGTTGQRPGSPTNGMIRYNTSLTALEAYVGGSWGPIGGGSGGGSPGGSVGNLQINAGSGAFGAYSGLSCSSHRFMNALDANGSSSADCVQPGFTDLSGTAANAQIPAPTTTGLGGLLALASATAHNVVQYIDNAGTQHLVQLAFSDLAGALSYSQMPNSGVTAGSYTSANVTVNAEGIVTSIANGSGGGSMVYPGAGIANSTGSAWGTSYSVSGTGSVLAATASPTFSGTVTLPAGQVVNGVTLSSAGSSSLFLNQAGTYSSPPGGGGLTVGTTTITGGASGKVEFNNGGVVGEYSISGTGNVAMTSSPVFTTPNLGTPSAVVLTNATGLPVAGGGTGSAYSGNAGLSNLLGSTPQLPHWNKALAKVMSGKGNARILLLGDSITQGFYSTNSGTGPFVPLSFGQQFANILNNSGIPASTDSFVGDASSGSGRTVTDARLTLGSGWSQGSGTGQQSLGGQWITASSATSSTSYTPNYPVDTFVVWYPTASGLGTLNYNIDGGSNTGINENGSNGLTSTVIHASSVGYHSLNLNWASGGSTIVVAIEAYNSSVPQVLVENAGWSGAKVSDVILNTNVWSPGPACGTYAPDLVVVMLQVNDENNAVSIPTYTSNLNSLLSACQAGGNTDIVFMTGNHIDPVLVSEATQGTYASAIRSVAASAANSAYVTGVPVIDEFQNFNSYNFETNVLGAIYSPGSSPADLHMNYIGYGLMARDIAQTLIPFNGSQNGGIAKVTSLNVFGGLGVAIGSTKQTSGTSLDLGSTTNSVLLPSGTTAQRPSSPLAGMIRYNSDTGHVEVYESGAWVNL